MWQRRQFVASSYLGTGVIWQSRRIEDTSDLEGTAILGHQRSGSCRDLSPPAFRGNSELGEAPIW